MAHDNRPLSPDLQIYRPQLTSVLSISHRVTGIALSVGAPLLVFWLLAAAAGPQAYSTVQGFLRSWLGLLPDVRMDVLLLLPSLQRHPAPRLGCRLRLRAAHDLCLRVDGDRGEYGSDCSRVVRQLCCGGVRSMNRHRMRSPLSRAQGLGSAREGVEHWWIQRVTAVALIPLTLWFTASLIALTGSDYDTFIAWLRAPFATILMVLLLIALFHHISLGLRVVVEDYVHSDRVKIPAVVAIRLACFALAIAGIFATLRITFNG